MATPFIPVSPGTAARNITKKAHEGLMDRSKYLVDSAIMDKVSWEPQGSGHRLVLPASHPPITREDTPSPDAQGDSLFYEDSNMTANDPPDEPSPTANNLPDVSTVSVPADPTVPATLTIVTELLLGQSWLYPDG